jgi:hypothetical protein
MTFRETAPPRRRRQILDDETLYDETRDNETRDNEICGARGSGAREFEDAWADGDGWVKSFITRLAHLLRRVGGKS